MSELLAIVRLGHPVLRQVASPVPQEAFGGAELAAFGKALISTMFHAKGVGLAAPQVARPQRVFCYFVPAASEDEDFQVPPTVLVNPVIEPLESSKVAGWEGCLSIPGLRGQVPRYPRIRVSAFDVEGRPLSFIAEDFHARVIQHELDHLDGIVYLDRMPDLLTLGYFDQTPGS